MKITLTGFGGTGTSTVGKLLAKKLACQFLSGGDMQRMVAKEKNMSLYEFDEYLKDHPDQDRLVEDQQITFGKEHNSFVMESLLSWYCVPDAFNVMLVCDFDTRIQRIASREGISFTEAKEKNVARVNTYQDRYGKLYGIENIMDEEHFDLVVDTTKLTPNEVVEKILSVATTV